MRKYIWNLFLTIISLCLFFCSSVIPPEKPMPPREVKLSEYIVWDTQDEVVRCTKDFMHLSRATRERLLGEAGEKIAEIKKQ